MAGEEPPYLTVGTDVSAKYKGAFCEAKIKKVTRSVKCKLTFKNNVGVAMITDDQVRGTLRVGAHVEAKHPERNQYLEAVINKLHDYSQYTVVFDDGDETTLRRTSLCLKSGRHFAESETLDQLPLTHPEHFGTPVMGTKGRKRRSLNRLPPPGDSSEDEVPVKKKVSVPKEPDPDMGKVVCVDVVDKKKSKDNWFPALIVSPRAQDNIRVGKDEYVVRSFKDGKYHGVNKKDTREFNREVGGKVDNNTLKTAVEKALQYVERDDLPPHWDRDILFANLNSSNDDNSDQDTDSDSSDDEQSEEKDRFVAQLYKFMDDRGTPINKAPTVSNRDLNLYKLFKLVQKLGGYNRVTNQMQWKTVYTKMGLPSYNTSSSHQIKQAYKKYLHSFEDFYRKLGCTMGTSTRSGRVRHRTGRSLHMSRDRDREFKAAGRRPPKQDSKAVKKEKEAEKEKPKPEDDDEQGAVDESDGNMGPTGGADKDEEAEGESHDSHKKDKFDRKCREEKDAKSPEAKGENDEDDDEEDDDDDDNEKDENRLRGKTRSEASRSDDALSSKRRISGRKKMTKKKDDEDGKSQDSDEEEAVASDDIDVMVGDRVKVKYGRGRQQKIYEAKVLKLDDEDGDKIYFVHYTGWNMRYDEWVKRHRIVENLTKKIMGKRTRTSAGKASNKGPAKRGRPHGSASSKMPSPGGSGRKLSGRSASKSRATRSDRSSLADSPFVKGLEPRRRPRKLSGHADFPGEPECESGDDSGTESAESDSDRLDQRLLRMSKKRMQADDLDTSLEEKDQEEMDDEDDDDNDEGGRRTNKAERLSDRDVDSDDKAYSSQRGPSKETAEEDEEERPTKSSKNYRKSIPARGKSKATENSDFEDECSDDEPTSKFALKSTRRSRGRPAKVAGEEVKEETKGKSGKKGKAAKKEEVEEEKRRGRSQPNDKMNLSPESMTGDSKGHLTESDQTMDACFNSILFGGGSGGISELSGGGASASVVLDDKTDLIRSLGGSEFSEEGNMANSGILIGGLPAELRMPLTKADLDEYMVDPPVLSDDEGEELAAMPSLEKAVKLDVCLDTIPTLEMEDSTYSCQSPEDGKLDFSDKIPLIKPESSTSADESSSLVASVIPEKTSEEERRKSMEEPVDDSQAKPSDESVQIAKMTKISDDREEGAPTFSDTVTSVRSEKAEDSETESGKTSTESNDTGIVPCKDAEQLQAATTPVLSPAVSSESVLDDSKKELLTTEDIDQELPCRTTTDDNSDSSPIAKSGAHEDTVKLNSSKDLSDRFDALRADSHSGNILQLEPTSKSDSSNLKLTSTTVSEPVAVPSVSDAPTTHGKPSKKDRRKQKNKKGDKRKAAGESVESTDDGSAQEDEPKVKKKKSREEKGDDEPRKEGKGKGEPKAKKSREKRSRSKKADSDREETKSQKKKGAGERSRRKECKKKKESYEKSGRCKSEKGGEDDSKVVPADSDDASSLSSDGGGQKKKKSRKHKSERTRDSGAEPERKRVKKSKGGSSFALLESSPSEEHTSDDSGHRELMTKASKKPEEKGVKKGGRKKKTSDKGSSKKEAPPSIEVSDSTNRVQNIGLTSTSLSESLVTRIPAVATIDRPPVVDTIDRPPVVDKFDKLLAETAKAESSSNVAFPVESGPECDMSRYLMCEEKVPASPMAGDLSGAALHDIDKIPCQVKREEVISGSSTGQTSSIGVLASAAAVTVVSPFDSVQAESSTVLDNTPPTTPEGGGSSAPSSFPLHRMTMQDSPSTSSSHDADSMTTLTGKSSLGSSPNAYSDTSDRPQHATSSVVLHSCAMNERVLGDVAPSAEGLQDPVDGAGKVPDADKPGHTSSSSSSSSSTAHVSTSKRVKGEAHTDSTISLRRRRRNHRKQQHLSGGDSVGRSTGIGGGIESRHRHSYMKLSKGSDSEDPLQPLIDSAAASHTLPIDRQILIPSSSEQCIPHSPRPSRFNFNVELGDYSDGAERIAILQEKLTELRRTYMALKAEVACIDRRRKKLKRKEKEATSGAPSTSSTAVECS